MPSCEARFAIVRELSKVKPIKPSEVQDKKNSKIPDSIINCVNEMIVEKWDGNKASFKQDDLLKRVLDVVLDTHRASYKKEIFAERWFDFEPLFRKAGWNVEYDKPAYNEDYPAIFVFSKSKNKEV